MKKYLGIALALVMSLFFFAGCSEGDTKGSNVKECIEAVYTEENTPLLNGELDYITKIKVAMLTDSDYAELNDYNDMVKALTLMTKTYYSNYGVIELKNTSGEVKTANDELKSASKELKTAIDTFNTQKQDYEDTLSKYEGNITDSLVCDQMLEEFKEDYFVLLKSMATFSQKFKTAFLLGYGDIVTNEETVPSQDEVKLASFVSLSDMALANIELSTKLTLDSNYYTSLNALILIMNTQEASEGNYFKWLSSYNSFKNEKLMLEEALNKLKEDDSLEVYLNKKDYFKNTVISKIITSTLSLFV